MQGLAGTKGEAIVYELLVFTECRSFQDFMAAVIRIVEKRMTYVFEMGPDLMCPAGFQHAFHDIDVSQPFQYLVMGDRMLPVTAVRVYGHNFTVYGMSADMTGDCSCICLQISPANRRVFSFGCFMKEL